MDKIFTKKRIKKLIFYLIWTLILLYLYSDFAKMKPFAKDSAFSRNSCKSKDTKTHIPIRYRGFSKDNSLYDFGNP
ncbi:MAG: hypothetical protein QM482_01225 [Sulfurospirillum sp.]